MAHLNDKDAYTHKKFDSSFYVHKKFGAIKLEAARKRKSEEFESGNYSSSVEILDVIVINVPKRKKLDEITKPANTFLNSQHKGHKVTSIAAAEHSQRKTKEMKIAPRPDKSSTSTPSSHAPRNNNFNAKSKDKEQQQLQPCANVSIAPITIATMPPIPQIASLVVTPTAPSTIAKSISPFPSASTIAYFNQTPPLSPVYGLANSYLQPVSSPNFRTSHWYNTQPTMQANFTTQASTSFCQPPMFYTHLLQRQMHAMTQRQSTVGKRQVSTVV